MIVACILKYIDRRMLLLFLLSAGFHLLGVCHVLCAKKDVSWRKDPSQAGLWLQLFHQVSIRLQTPLNSGHSQTCATMHNSSLNDKVWQCKLQVYYYFTWCPYQSRGLYVWIDVSYSVAVPLSLGKVAIFLGTMLEELYWWFTWIAWHPLLDSSNLFQMFQYLKQVVFTM